MKINFKKWKHGFTNFDCENKTIYCCKLMKDNYYGAEAFGIINSNTLNVV